MYAAYLCHPQQTEHQKRLEKRLWRNRRLLFAFVGRFVSVRFGVDANAVAAIGSPHLPRREFLCRPQRPRGAQWRGKREREERGWSSRTDGRPSLKDGSRNDTVDANHSAMQNASEPRQRSLHHRGHRACRRRRRRKPDRPDMPFRTQDTQSHWLHEEEEQRERRTA